MKDACRRRKDSVFMKVDPLMVELKRSNLLALIQTKHAERSFIAALWTLCNKAVTISFHMMKKKFSEETLLLQGLLNEERRGRNKGGVGRLCLCSAD